MIVNLGEYTQVVFGVGLARVYVLHRTEEDLYYPGHMLWRCDHQPFLLLKGEATLNMKENKRRCF